MLQGQSREEIRSFFFEVWRKHRTRLPLEPLEALIADIIEAHPEYHRYLDAEQGLEKDFLPEFGETNPFLHLGLHIALKEQIATNRPPGVFELYQQIVKKIGSQHEAEHAMIDCLAETLWRAQRDNTAPDEQGYLESLKRLV